MISFSYIYLTRFKVRPDIHRKASIVPTYATCTLENINISYAPDTREARSTRAREAVHIVVARGTILTGIAVALVDVILTMNSSEPRHADAVIAADFILAGASILTGSS